MSHTKNKNEELQGACVAINNYICSSCRHNHIAVEVNPGITPEVIDCQKDGCDGKARSLNYPVIASSRNIELTKSARFEFYRPEKAENPFESLDLEGGVLKLRERTSATPITINFYREWRSYTQKNLPASLTEQHIAEEQIKIKASLDLYVG